MSGSLAVVNRCGQSSHSPDTEGLGSGSYTEDRTYDSLGSSTELTDVFDEDDVFCEDEPWSPPVADLQLKIAAQLEHYLSNESLSEDPFLLKHVQKNKMQYVSLKLLTSFKRIKELTRDWRTTLAAARISVRLEVNKEGTKVRRSDPVPDWLLRVPTSKLLLAWNLLEGGVQEVVKGTPGVEKQDLMEMAMRLFGCHGTITSLRILRPGKEVPAELRRYTKKHCELGRELCAVVEYEYLDGARRACEALLTQQGVIDGVRVALLGCRGICKTGRSQDHTEEESEDGVESVCSRKPYQRKARRPPYYLEDSVMCSSSESDFTPASPRPIRRVARPQALYGSPLAIPRATSLCTGPYRNPAVSTVSSPLLPRKLFSSGHAPSPLATSEFSSSSASSGNGTLSRKCSGDYNSQDSLAGSPWVHRRKTAAQAFFPEKGGPGAQLHILSSRSPGAVEVLRQPMGPDGTKGFYNRIGRGKIILRL